MSQRKEVEMSGLVARSWGDILWEELSVSHF